MGYVLFFTGARIIGTTRAVILTVTEPIFANFLAILLVHEWLTPLQWLGVAVVIGSLLKLDSNGNLLPWRVEPVRQSIFRLRRSDASLDGFAIARALK